MTNSQKQPDSIADSSLFFSKDLPLSMSLEESENKLRIINDIHKSELKNQTTNHDVDFQKQQKIAYVDTHMQVIQAKGPYSNMEKEKLEWLVEETLEGFVEEINGNKFYVGFLDNHDVNKIPKYLVEFEKEELAENERSQLQVGSHIQCKYGVRVSNGGQPVRDKQLRLSNFNISEVDLERARLDASKLMEGLEWDE